MSLETTLKQIADSLDSIAAELTVISSRMAPDETPAAKPEDPKPKPKTSKPKASNKAADKAETVEIAEGDSAALIAYVTSKAQGLDADATDKIGTLIMQDYKVSNLKDLPPDDYADFIKDFDKLVNS